jgi:hypothetical protein
MAYSDQELLKIVADERQRSIGFEHDAELLSDRQRALRFMKGDMREEMPTQPNRSAATSTDVLDAINTLTPDLLEIFTSGDDVVAFKPNGPEDEAGARQETDYISHVVFQENDGFMLFNTFIMDALSQKIGVLKFWRETEKPQDERLTGQSPMALHMAIGLDAAEPTAALLDIKPSEEQTGDELVFDATVRKTQAKGRICIESVAPEDFTVAADTVRLRDTTYCAHRTRVRAQELLASGIDAEIVARLPDAANDTSQTAQSRDTAGESSVSQGSDSLSPLRMVEIVEHYVRLLEGDRLVIWRVQTGADESVLIDKEEVNRFPFAAITPFVVTHRFYGRSVADLLIETQKINTALTRMGLDSGYFALNQRMEVAEDQTSDTTMFDLMANEPGRPIMSKTGKAVRAIGAGTINFDVFGALEYFQTKAEQHTGIVRNAQGLNPDTLHDTAKGAAMLMGAAQKRIRMIARIFAETGVKDLYLGVHALIREDGASHKREAVRLRGGWEPIDPTSWGERADMTIEVGLGAGGRDYDLAQTMGMIGVAEKLIDLQGGVVTPDSDYVTPSAVYALAERAFAKMGAKRPDLYLANPSRERQQATGEPPPDPAMLKLEGEMKLAAAKQAGELKMAQMKAANDLAIAMKEAENDLILQREKMQLEMQAQEAQAAGELELKRRELELEAQIKGASALSGMVTTPVLPDVNVGGEPG